MYKFLFTKIRYHIVVVVTVFFLSIISNTKSLLSQLFQNSEKYINIRNKTKKINKIDKLSFLGKTNLKVLFCHVIQIVSVLKVPDNSSFTQTFLLLLYFLPKELPFFENLLLFFSVFLCKRFSFMVFSLVLK